MSLDAGSAASAVVDFWRAAGPDRWFEKSPAFDEQFRERFLGEHLAAARRERDDWIDAADSALALVILLDQFPRNVFRGTAHMYATDPLARCFASRLVEAGFDQAIEVPLRLFCYLPFAHSEDLADQRRSVELHARIGRPWLDHAEGHFSIVERFGRFPHRNSLLGRETTPAERAFLADGGFAG